MTIYRSIEQILPPPPVHMVGDGFRVHNFFPSDGRLSLQRLSPFFLMDYASKFEYSPTETQRGVGVHPHRGFETVTIAYHGKLAHHDSAGNAGIIGEGDVQWMTAASGVLHKEYHEKEWSRRGGLMQMVQLWVNLPARYKMSTPKYQPIYRSELGKFMLPNSKGLVEVICGNFKDVKGPASSFTAIEMYNVRLDKGAELTFSFPDNFNTAFLIVDGQARVNGSLATADHLVVFANEKGDICLEAMDDNTVVLVLSGEPLNESIFPYGPFLMNTKQEIIQAYDDLNNGKFGYLAD